MISRVLGAWRRYVPRGWRNRVGLKQAVILLLLVYMVVMQLKKTSLMAVDRYNGCVQNEDRCCQVQSVTKRNSSSNASRRAPKLLSFRRNHVAACSDRTELLIMVNSAPGNILSRSAMRDTWLTQAQAHGDNVTVLFFMGSGEPSDVTESLTEEDIVFEDIIQADFKDTYNNLTLKTTTMLQWVLQHCPQAKQILKVDDDVYLHFDNFLSITHRTRRYPRHILGKIGLYEKPNHETERYKWAIRKEEFSEEMFPAFAHGPAYVISGDLVSDLFLEAASHKRPLKLEDVFITGICARAVGAVHVGDCGFIFDWRRFFPRATSVSAHGYTPDGMRRIHWAVRLLNWVVPFTDFVLWLAGE